MLRRHGAGDDRRRGGKAAFRPGSVLCRLNQLADLFVARPHCIQRTLTLARLGDIGAYPARAAPVILAIKHRHRMHQANAHLAAGVAQGNFGILDRLPGGKRRRRIASAGVRH